MRKRTEIEVLATPLENTPGVANLAVAPRAAARDPVLPTWDPALPPPVPARYHYAWQTLLGVWGAVKLVAPCVYREARAVSRVLLCLIAWVLDFGRDALEALGIPVSLDGVFFALLVGALVYKARSVLLAFLAYLRSVIMSVGPQLLGYYMTMHPPLRDHAIPCLRAFRFFVASFFPKHKEAVDALAGDVEMGYREAAGLGESGGGQD